MATKKSTKKTTKKSGRKRSGGAEASAETAAEFPRQIYANASPRSIGQVSMFEPDVMAERSTVGNFASDPADVERAANLLRDAGFEVLDANQYLINICGSRTTYERAFGTELTTVEREVVKNGVETTGTHIDCTGSSVDGFIPVEGTRFEEVLEGIAIEEPYYLDAPTPFPPPVDYFHLSVPGDVAVAVNAEKAHRSGITGKGVDIVMVDSGMAPHRFFSDRGYRVEPTVLGPGTSDPTEDAIGHGTGEAANIFAAAPDVRLTPLKIASSSGALVNTTAAINLAASLDPDIITNSWGSNRRFGPLSASSQALAVAVAAAVADGSTVVFSAGNGSFGFPGQHPDVISAGGVYMHQDGSLEASDYASGFTSNIYAGRKVPDVSGLVGMRPKAAYIMLPLEEGASIDVGNAGGNHPNGDETAPDDGWAAFSGTSAAAPQIAGVCALIRQACARLGPEEMKDILMKSARDVTRGTGALGSRAGRGYDTATGAGLVNAHRAVLLAKLRCIVFPVIPLQPILPVQPFQPVQPFLPVQPFRPIQPFQPFQPIRPVLPFRPIAPFRPPIGRERDPSAQAGETGPTEEASVLSPEDLAELERMVLEDNDPFDG